MSYLISRCIDLGAVLTKKEIAIIEEIGGNYETINKMIMKMTDDNFSKLIDLINDYDPHWRFSDDQRWWDKGNRDEKEIKELMRDYLWDDIDPFIKEEWRKEAIKNMS